MRGIMGFVIGGQEVRVTADGLIHLADLVGASLGMDTHGAAREIAGMQDAGGFPDVRCFKRGASVLVTSGGAESVLVRLVQAGRGFKGPVVMAMRCFMSQNGPFAPRIREGTALLPAKDVCAEFAGEPDASGWFLDDLEWAHPDSVEPAAECAAEADADADADASVDECPTLVQHGERAADLELDQLEGTVESLAREAQCEHFGAVVTRYRELCEDTAVDERGVALFKQVLLGMLSDSAPVAPSHWQAGHAGGRHRLRLTGLELDQLKVATERRAREAQREHYDRVARWYRELCEDTAIDAQGKDLFKDVLAGMIAPPGRVGTDRRAREAWRRGVDISLG